MNVLKRISAAAIVAALMFLSLPTPAKASGSAYVSSQPRSSTISTGPLTLVDSARFSSGTKMVSARFDAVSAQGASLHLMLTGVLTCGNQTSLSGVNLTTGSGYVIARRIMNDPTRCTASAQSALGRTPKDRLLVRVTWSAEPVKLYSSSFSYTAYPKLLRAGGTYDVTPTRIELPPGAGYVRLRADFRFTSCTVSSGSRENGSPELCQGSDVALSGTKFRIRVIVQYGAPGRACHISTVSDRVIVVDKWLHHGQAYYAANIPDGCSSTVRAKMRVQVLSGAALVANSQGTATDLYR